jgi:hypothetical protein
MIFDLLWMRAGLKQGTQAAFTAASLIEKLWLVRKAT